MFDTAYNLNCWLLLFQREATTKVAELKHIGETKAERFVDEAKKL